MEITMKKLIIILVFAGLASACDPQETYDRCRDGHNGNTDPGLCGVQALGHMFMPRNW